MAIPSRARLSARRTAPGKHARRPGSDATVQPSPIVKWAGGKTKLLSELIARTPGGFRRYFEPFAGGAALFYRLAPRAAVLCDRNADLVNTYRCVAWQVDAVLRRLAHHQRKHDEAYYYQMRERWNRAPGRDGDVDRAALFIYLNKTCYNGLWRVNSKGHFNVPAGRYASPKVHDPSGLRAAAELLRRAELVAGHYADAVESAEAGDFVYFDPPYHPLSRTASFTSYTAGDFGEDDQRQLAEVARALADRGCAVMLSNSDTPFIRELYRGWRIDAVTCPRAINSRASARGRVGEVLVTSELLA